MSNSGEETSHSHEYYNEEPVFYCKNCLSLRILSIGNTEGNEFCYDCSSTDIDTCLIDEWEKLYQNKYGFKYLDKK